jgi:hypothetical protein
MDAAESKPRRRCQTMGDEARARRHAGWLVVLTPLTFDITIPPPPEATLPYRR